MGLLHSSYTGMGQLPPKSWQLGGVGEELNQCGAHSSPILKEDGQVQFHRPIASQMEARRVQVLVCSSASL